MWWAVGFQSISTAKEYYPDFVQVERDIGLNVQLCLAQGVKGAGMHTDRLWALNNPGIRAWYIANCSRGGNNAGTTQTATNYSKVQRTHQLNSPTADLFRDADTSRGEPEQVLLRCRTCKTTEILDENQRYLKSTNELYVTKTQRCKICPAETTVCIPVGETIRYITKKPTTSNEQLSTPGD
jgi:hypothetical protein